jgi:hypothetical protein
MARFLSAAPVGAFVWIFPGSCLLSLLSFDPVQGYGKASQPSTIEQRAYPIHIMVESGILKPKAGGLTRRERFRRFMWAFNPTASPRELIKEGLLLEDLHRSVYQSFAARADLEPGSQQLIIGGIGSGKTTELLMAEGWLNRQEHCITQYIDITAETDLSDLKSGALIAALGLHLIRMIRIENKTASIPDAQKDEFAKAKKDVQEFALGKTTRVWVEDSDEDWEPDPDDDGFEAPGHYVISSVPGKLTPPVPHLKKDVQSISESLGFLLLYLTTIAGKQRDLVVLFDGLDRLVTPEKFWSVAHQDLRILKKLKVSVLATAPLTVLYEGREIAEQFDRVHHLATLSSDDPGREQLESVLLRRGGDLLLSSGQMALLCENSGGVLRDLITMARDSAEDAYIAGENRITDSNIDSAVAQLGTSYLRGLSVRQRNRLRSIDKYAAFDFNQQGNMELLATRRVLEYSATEFRVHPALMNVLSKLEGVDV